MCNEVGCIIVNTVGTSRSGVEDSAPQEKETFGMDS
jgi:hypothetical protein